MSIDRNKFPVTTQIGLSDDDQALIDAINLDALRQAIADGETLDDERRTVLTELEEKHRLRASALQDEKAKASPWKLTPEQLAEVETWSRGYQGIIKDAGKSDG